MPPYPNLVSNSTLINETISLLQTSGGRASAVKIVDFVMKIRKPPPDLAKLLVSDLVERDPRLKLIEDSVELVENENNERKLNETDYVVFDLETTGAKCPPCRVTEIGAYRVSKGKINDEFHSLINPETPIPNYITQLTGISDDMVKDEPKFHEIADDLLAFIGDSVLVAHNAQFDLRFLNHEIGRVYENCRIANPYLCTVQLSRKLLPHMENHKLHTLAGYYQVALVNHHRASEDARATAKIFINLLDELNNRGVEDLAKLKKIKF